MPLVKQGDLPETVEGITPQKEVSLAKVRKSKFGACNSAKSHI